MRVKSKHDIYLCLIYTIYAHNLKVTLHTIPTDQCFNCHPSHRYGTFHLCCLVGVQNVSDSSTFHILGLWLGHFACISELLLFLLCVLIFLPHPIIPCIKASLLKYLGMGFSLLTSPTDTFLIPEEVWGKRIAGLILSLSSITVLRSWVMRTRNCFFCMTGSCQN